MLSCPVCAQPLVAADSAMRCEQGHGYDLAREGYVNLLLAQQRHSRDPGYSREMIAARRDFFDAGHYQAHADDLARIIRGHLSGEPAELVVDAGCGEGYYLRRLRVALESSAVVGAGAAAAPGPVLCGLDISKHGVRVAARRDRDGVYAVAGTHRMPVLAERVSVLLTHFSPVSPDDFARVVRPGGVVLVAGPGEDHLYSFKQLLYDAPTAHRPVDQLAGDARFERLGWSRIRHPLHLKGAQHVRNLLAMTPFFWTLDAAGQARLGRVEQLITETDIVVRAYRRLPLTNGHTR